MEEDYEGLNLQEMNSNIRVSRCIILEIDVANVSIPGDIIFSFLTTKIKEVKR